MDDLTIAVMATADEETESEVSTETEDDTEDGAHGEIEEQVEVKEDTELTSQLPDCQCFFPDPQIPCVLFKGVHHGEEDDYDVNLGVPIFKVKLIKEYLLDPARELTGPLGVNLLPHIPLISIAKTNGLLRCYCLDQVVRHIAKAYPASLPRHVQEALGWSKEILKSNERVKLQCELLWWGFLTLVKSSQSAHPLVAGQQGVLAVKGLSLTLIRGVFSTIRLAYGISGLPHISSAHSLFIKRLVEFCHIRVTADEDGDYIETHLSPAQTMKMTLSGFSAFSTLGLRDIIENMISKCTTCQDTDDEICEPPGIFRVALSGQSRRSPLYHAPQLLQLSRDIKGPWKIRFQGIGTGIYHSYLEGCVCHRLLGHRERSKTEDYLQLASIIEVTVHRCDCPGTFLQEGTDFKLTLIWQLGANHRQNLKQKRLVLVKPQYVYGDSEASLQLIYRGDNPGEFWAAMASRIRKMFVLIEMDN